MVMALWVIKLTTDNQALLLVGSWPFKSVRTSKQRYIVHNLYYLWIDVYFSRFVDLDGTTL